MDRFVSFLLERNAREASGFNDGRRDAMRIERVVVVVVDRARRRHASWTDDDDSFSFRKPNFIERRVSSTNDRTIERSNERTNERVRRVDTFTSALASVERALSRGLDRFD